MKQAPLLLLLLSVCAPSARADNASAKLPAPAGNALLNLNDAPTGFGALAQLFDNARAHGSSSRIPVTADWKALSTPLTAEPVAFEQRGKGPGDPGDQRRDRRNDRRDDRRDRGGKDKADKKDPERERKAKKQPGDGTQASGEQSKKKPSFFGRLINGLKYVGTLVRRSLNGGFIVGALAGAAIAAIGVLTGGIGLAAAPAIPAVAGFLMGLMSHTA